MESNINQQEIRDYSQRFGRNIMRQTFINRQAVGGQDILTLTPVKQVNFFVLKQLLDSWQSESAQLKSPYFDYEAEEVQQAMQQFMNVLSRHIRIEQDALLPLLTKATEEALLLIFSPYAYYLHEISKPGRSKLMVADLKKLKKYVKINDHLLGAYIARFESEGIEAIFSEDAVRIFNEVCERTDASPEAVDAHLSDFAQIEPLDADTLYRGGDSANAAAHPARQPSETTQRKTLLDTLSSGGHEYEALPPGSVGTTGELKKKISINQRFMFVRELFGGNADEFEMVVEHLDNCQSREEAMDFLTANYIKKKNWDSDKEEVQEFFELIDRRFGR
jgi:hypothetical protein